jgi:type I restriction enzyme S subunit
MWFKRPEFDREAAFIAVGGVRGSMPWKEFAKMKLPVPPIKKQRKIVNAYKIVTDRIALKQKINDNLESMLTAVYFEQFYSSKASEYTKLSDLMVFGNGKSRPKTNGTIPVYGGNGVLSYTDKYNAENTVLIGRVGAYCGSVYLEQSICWVSDNAIFAKSKITNDEFFDYFLLKGLNLFNHHVGTGQQLLTQDILNNIEVPKPDIEQIGLFNMKAKSVFETISANKCEIIRLKKLSDLLLARLAS